MKKHQKEKEEKIEKNEPIIKKKSFYKKKWLYIAGIVAVLVVGLIIYRAFAADRPIEYETVKVERGSLRQTVDATGNIESTDEFSLRFESSGRVGKVYKKVNDGVVVGEKIAELELAELNARIAQASASVSRAYANLNKELAGSTEDYISGLKAKLRQAEANLEQSQANYASLINQAEADVETAYNNLKKSEGGEDSLIVEYAYEDMSALLRSIQAGLSKALIEADNILGVDNERANDDFENVLSALNQSKLFTARNNYNIAKSSKHDADVAINLLNGSSNRVDVDAAAVQAEKALNDMRALLFSMSEVLDNTIPIGSLSQSELDIMKTNIQAVRSSGATDYAGLLNQKQAIESAKNSYGNYKIAYDSSLSYLYNLRKRSNADAAFYQATVDQAKATLQDAENPPREVDLAAYRASLWEAQANLSQMVAIRDKSIIKSPMDGTIGKINAKVGEFITSQEVAVKLISPHFEVKVDIPETDIIKMSLGDKTEIKLDAYGDEPGFSGMVTEIEKGETIIQDVVYYTVTVSIDDSEDYEILNGMTANIVFYTQKKDDILFIPLRTIKRDEEGGYVNILENNELKKIYIETGLRGDGGLVEVVSGLIEGQEVIVRELTKT